MFEDYIRRHLSVLFRVILLWSAVVHQLWPQTAPGTTRTHFCTPSKPHHLNQLFSPWRALPKHVFSHLFSLLLGVHSSHLACSFLLLLSTSHPPIFVHCCTPLRAMLLGFHFFLSTNCASMSMNLQCEIGRKRTMVQEILLLFESKREQLS